MPHVDDGTLHALLDGALRAHEPDRADRVEAHLDACADCRARMEEAATLRDRAAEVLGAADAGVVPKTGAYRGADAADRPGAAEPVPDFQEVLARAAAGRGEQEPDGRGVGAPTDSDVPAASAGSERAGSIRRRYRWTRGLAWAATIVVALGTGYLVRDLAGPTGIVPPARSALEQAAPESAAERDAAAEAMADETRVAGPESEKAAAGPEAETSAIGQEAGATRTASGEGGGAEAVAGEPTGAAADSAATAAPATAAQALATGEATDSSWRTASLEEAAARAGAVLRLPTASVASVELGADGSIRTRQLLAEGVEVQVVQAAMETTAREALDAAPAEDRALRRRAEAPVANAMAPTAAVPSLLGLDLDSAAATVAAPVTVRVARDGYVLTLTGKLPEDVLRALAATAAAGDG